MSYPVMAQQPDVAAVQVRVTDALRTSLAVRFVGALGGQATYSAYWTA